MMGKNALIIGNKEK